MATTVAPKRKPRKKSVLKAIRQTRRRTAINRANRSHLRTQLKRFRLALDAENLPQARELLSPILSILDRSVRKRLLHPNTAARTKSRLLVRFNALARAQAAR
jgi:small subunit ribosomal protein S20